MRERSLRKQPTFRDANIYSSRKDVWETREEIPYWWQVTIQSASDWLKRIFHAVPTTNKKHRPDLGSDTSSVGSWGHISRGNQWLRREMSAVFSG